MKLIILYISVIILKAISDGLDDSGSKGLEHALTSLWIAGLIIVPNFLELPPWHVQLIAFTLFMIAIFDYAYNITRGLGINHVGTTSWWDNAIKRVPFGYMLFVRVLCLITGIFLII